MDEWAADLNRARASGRRYIKDKVWTGLRGVGKSVLLKNMRTAAESVGFEVLPFQSDGTALVTGLLARATRRADQGVSAWDKAAVALRRISAVTAGPVKVDLTRPQAAERAATDAAVLAELLAELAHDLSRHSQGGLVLMIDEFQMSDPQDIRTIGALLNHLNQHLDDAPVLFVAAGLPNTQARMVGPDPDHPLISNPERLFQFQTLGTHLSVGEAASALIHPALRRGASWEPVAVQRVLELSGRYPAHLQAYAAAAWAQGEGMDPVTLEHVERSSVAARREIEEQYLAPRWSRLSERQQEYLAALSYAGGEARSGEVAATVGRTTTEVSEARAALLKRGEIYDPRNGWVALTMPAMAEYALEHYPDTVVDSDQDLCTPGQMVTQHEDWSTRRLARQQEREAFPSIPGRPEISGRRRPEELPRDARER
ncbi:ATP-binding protein [Naumannella sp. ID2617S]|nr:ATP-binding protein [Naumannella sp. ID2617S]